LGGTEAVTVPFNSPLLRRKVRGEFIVFDVTLSAPSSPIALNTIDLIIKDLKKDKVRTVLDFGAGRLRNTWPLLKVSSFEVYICEFDKLINRESASIAKATRSGLKTLIYPKDFLATDVTFDAVLMSHVLHIIPGDRARKMILKACYQRMRSGGILVVASPNYNAPIRQTCKPSNAYGDGWVRYAKGRYQHKTFYSEPSRAELIEMMKRSGFVYQAQYQQRSAKVLRFRKEK